MVRTQPLVHVGGMFDTPHMIANSLFLWWISLIHSRLGVIHVEIIGTIH